MELALNNFKMEEQINTQPGIEQKKSKWLIWLIVGIVIIGIAIGIYFWLTGDTGSANAGNSLVGIGGGNSIPQPPALPN